MADFKLAWPVIAEHEGLALTETAGDRGGLTKGGVTLSFLKACGSLPVHSGGGDVDGNGVVDEHDLALLTPDEIAEIFRVHFWDRWSFDDLSSQELATKITDLCINVGEPQGVHLVQRSLNALGAGLSEDGALGSRTVHAVAEAAAARLLPVLCAHHLAFYRHLVAVRPDQMRFLVDHNGKPGGWWRRAAWPYSPAEVK